MLIRIYNHPGLKCGDCGNHLHSDYRIIGNIRGFHCTGCRDVTTNLVPVNITELYKDKPEGFGFYVPDDKPYDDVFRRKYQLWKGFRATPKFIVRIMMFMCLPCYILESLFSEISLKDWWKMVTMEIK